MLLNKNSESIMPLSARPVAFYAKRNAERKLLQECNANISVEPCRTANNSFAHAGGGCRTKYLISRQIAPSRRGKVDAARGRCSGVSTFPPRRWRVLSSTTYRFWLVFLSCRQSLQDAISHQQADNPFSPRRRRLQEEIPHQQADKPLPPSPAAVAGRDASSAGR